MFGVLFTVIGFVKASLYYVLLVSWRTGRFIIAASKLLVVWLNGIAEYIWGTLQIILEDFQPFASDILRYLQALLQGLAFVKNGVLSVFYSIYSVLSATVHWCLSLVVQTFTELTNVVLSVIGGVSEVFAFIKRLLILFGSGVWFLVTLIPLSVVSFFIYSTYCLGLLLHEAKHLTTALLNKIISIYEFVTDVPLESLAGLAVGVCLVYIFVQFHVVLYQFLGHKFRVFMEIARRKVVSLQWSFHRNQDDRQSETEEDVSEENYCIICQERVKNVLLLPCKHVCVCSYCEVKLNRYGNRCPVCRTNVHRTMKVFI